MSQLFDQAAAPTDAGPPPGAGNPLTAALGTGPGGSDVAQLPPELAAALGGGQQPPDQQPEMEPASIEAAMEHIQMGLQMLQELQVGETDNMKMDNLNGLISPLTKMLAGRQKQEQMAAATQPGGGSAPGA